MFGAFFIRENGSFDIVIIDSKLSKGTNFTDNQIIANSMSDLVVKTMGAKIKGELPDGISIRQSLKKTEVLRKFIALEQVNLIL